MLYKVKVRALVQSKYKMAPTSVNVVQGYTMLKCAWLWTGVGNE